MARKGENIRKRKDGRWEARFRKGSDSNNAPVYASIYGKTYKEVKEKRIALQSFLYAYFQLSAFSAK